MFPRRAMDGAPTTLDLVEETERMDDKAVSGNRRAVIVCVLGGAAGLTFNLNAWASNHRKGRKFVPDSWLELAVIAVNFAFLIALLIAASSVLRNLRQLRQGTVAFSFCSLAPVCLVIYWFFSVAHTFAQHSAAQIGISKIIPTILIYFSKLILALGMYRCSDGSFADLRNSLLENKLVVRNYVLSASCMALYDLLSFLTLAKLSPAKYQVLLHLRTVLIAFFWQIVMKKQLSRVQWAALLLCVWAALLTERAALAEIFGGDDDTMTTLGPYCTLAVQYVLALVGNLSNEKFLKEVNLPVNAQNFIMYAIGSTALMTGFGLYTLVSGELLFPMADLPLLAETSVWMSVVTLSLLGISAGYVLKTSGNIFKELAGMMVTFTTATFDWTFLGNPFNVLDIQAVVIIALGLGFFSLMHIVDSMAVKAKGKVNENYYPADMSARWFQVLASTLVVTCLPGFLGGWQSGSNNFLAAANSIKLGE